MTCEQSEVRMAEFLAGEIAPEDRAALEKHLLDCASCRADYELARAGARVEWADVTVPKEVVEATLLSFREPPIAARLLRWATAAAAVLCVATLLVSSGRRPTPAPVELPAACSAERPAMLATMQDPAVGALLCKDEDGRPVGELGLKSHAVSVEILDGIAKTTVEENFENHTDRRLEGTFQFPLPSDASISRLALEVNGKIEEGTCLEREKAREVFERIVRRMQDPALLEWQPGGFFKCRVFPIEARATKRVIVAYTQALPYFRGKMTYFYPLASEKTRTHPPEEVTIDVQARFSGPLAKIESTSHHLDVRRRSPNEASMTFHAVNYRPNNDFVVSLEPADEEVRVVSHKTDGEDGYFACFVTPRGGGERTPNRYTFVLDVSASTSAPKLEVAKRLVRAMMERRIEGDRFEILAHHIEVERSGEVDLRAANDFMDRLRPIGGSDVQKALLAAGEGEIVYIGKGAPTMGESDPSKILESVKGRRIRTIAVGSDANGTLLEKLGGMMRVNPNDDVPRRVAEIAETLGSPVLSEIKLEAGDAVYDVAGVRDIFFGERLVVTGRYRGPAAKLAISGRGWSREADVSFPPKEEGNNYVRRLWAQRKVSDLLAQGESKKQEVTDLGVKYQIMTPYTSFLVLESEQMWKDYQLKREVQKQDEVLGKGKVEVEKRRMAEAEASAHEISTKREVTRNMAHLLELAYLATDQRKFDRTIQLCDELLRIDPHYSVAKELKEDAEKARHKEEYWSVLAPKIETWKRLTDDDDLPVIPFAHTVRFPSRDEWGEISKRLTQAVIKTEGEVDPAGNDERRIAESRRHYDQAVACQAQGQLDRAKAEAARAVEAWSANLSARILLNHLDSPTAAPRPEAAQDGWRVRIEQSQIEITKHVRDAERFMAARMFEQAAREFESAEFKLKAIPYDLPAMSGLLPAVRDGLARAKRGEDLESRRVQAEKNGPPGSREVSEWEELLKKLKSTYDVTEAEKVSEANKHYRAAERLYQEGDFEKSSLEAQKALQISPNHAAARALFMEEQFILGQGGANPASVEYDRFMREALVRHQQTMIELDGALERGKQSLNRGEFDKAELEFRKIREYGKWIPEDVESSVRVKQAVELLDRTASMRRNRDVDEEKSRLRLVEEEKARDDFRPAKPEPTPAPRPAPTPVEPIVPVAKNEPPAVKPSPLAAPYDPNGKEDPRAKAIREAYEEQIRRERQEVTIAGYTGATRTIVEDFRRQAGWNLTVDTPRPTWTLHRPTPNQSGGLEFTLNEDPIEGRRWKYDDARIQTVFDTPTMHDFPGVDIELAAETSSLSVPGIYSLTTNVVAPGEAVTDPLPITLNTENVGKAARINDLQRFLDARSSLLGRTQADLLVHARQLEVQQAQIQELTTRLSEQRARLTADEATRLNRDLVELETKFVETARAKKFTEEKINAIAQAGGNANGAPKKALEGKTTAVSKETGLIVFSIGKEDGVLEGDEFTVYRGGEFVAKVVVDRADRKWSAGKTVLKKSDPRVGDDISNHIFVSSPAIPAACATPCALEVDAASGDGSLVMLRSGKEPVQVGQLFALVRDGKFVAMLRVERAVGPQVEARIWNSLAVGRILPGDRAERVVEPQAYLAALPAEVRMDLASRINLQTIRAKMGMRE